MILEGLVTTRDPDGSPHLAPMGPRVADDYARFTLRPFPTSHTYQNLLLDRQGVLHVTDNALMLARAAIGPVQPFPDFRPSASRDMYWSSPAGITNSQCDLSTTRANG
jgi:hypothetical protein